MTALTSKTEPATAGYTTLWGTTPLEPVFDRYPGFRRIYIDLPGHGDSPRLPGPTSALTLTEAVIGWIADVMGDEPFAVVGQSFGGQIARAVTARFGPQVLGSALFVPVVRWGEARTLPSETIVERNDVFLASLSPVDQDLFAFVATRLDQPGWERFAQYLLPGWRVHDQNAAAELESNFLLPSWPEQEDAPHRGPHLLVTGRQDALVGWQDQLDLLQYYPHMTAAVIDGAGHNPQIETPDIVRDLVGRWLDAFPRDTTSYTSGGQEELVM
ncbi:MAG TPA: alpha/beta hydrolase [Plantibacter sp.]|uniref:alpha/beta fold hydrolase n=1 Tax=unclassified Plantibacter TaxID=2624265 RepID=UPI002B6231F8|nr:alpha/beta hydrolase [Plantibacter sp.]